jgi:hypothetical protein
VTVVATVFDGFFGFRHWLGIDWCNFTLKHVHQQPRQQQHADQRDGERQHDHD